MQKQLLAARTLPELSTEIFLVILRVQKDRDIGSFESLHDGVQALFKHFEEQARAQNLNPDDVSLAKYGLAAFMDETVLNSPWPYKDRWADNPLQLDYFGTYLAGEIFFDKLEELRAAGGARPDLLEIYYLCLLLGFRGKYGVSGEEKLKVLVDQVGAELKRVKPESTADLSPHWSLPDEPLSPQGDRLPRWVVWSCYGLAALFLVIYVVLFFKVRHDADSLKERIQGQSALLSFGPLPSSACESDLTFDEMSQIVCSSPV